MTSELKVPESRGKFRKDVHERAVKLVKARQPERFPYRAVGENPRESAWGRGKDTDDLRGLINGLVRGENIASIRLLIAFLRKYV